MIRKWALILVFCMLLQLGAAAAGLQLEDVTDPSAPTEESPTEPSDPTEPIDPTEPSKPSESTDPSEPTEPEPAEPEPAEPAPTEPPDPAEGYIFPENWSKDALIFMVRNGLYIGDQNHDLCPDDFMTRAEMACMLVRLLHLTDQADLSRFQDVEKGSWYYDSMAAAVAAGIFNGTTETTMDPNSPITREQTFAVLCRALAIVSPSQELYAQFPDASKISNYAKIYVSAMAEKGIVHGYEDGTLRPKASITRAEVAMLIYNLLDAITEDPAQIPSEGNVLYSGPLTLPEGLIHQGSLLLVPTSGDLSLSDLTVTGDLVLLNASRSSITLSNCAVGSLVCASAGSTISGSDGYDLVYLAAGNMDLDLDAGTLIAHSGTGNTASGNYESVIVRQGAGITLTGNLNSLVIYGPAEVVLDGTVEDVTLYGTDISMTGTGSAGQIVNYSLYPQVTIDSGAWSELADYGLSGVALTFSGPTTLTQVQQTITITANFSGGVFTGVGTNQGQRTCALSWYRNGKLLHTDASFRLYEGATSSYSFSYNFNSGSLSKDIFTVTLTYGDQELSRQHTVVPNDYLKQYQSALSTVTTANVEMTLLYNTPLYSDRGQTNRIGTIAANTVVTLEYRPTTQTMQVTAPDGRTGWIPGGYGTISSKNFTDSTNDYSLGAKEGFVNRSGYTSQTEYLIWVSRKTQHVNIYQGSAGNWKLIQSFLCSTGANTTPTPKGVFSITRRSSVWNFSGYYVSNVSVFNGGHAFHSIPLNYDGSVYDGRLGTPLSHGCVRMNVEDCAYIYSLPLDTCVIIY